MKLKKTLSIITAATLAMATMVGCSQSTINYSKEVSKIANWETASSNIEGKVNVDVTGLKEEITFTATGYRENNKSCVDMKFNDPSGKINIPEFKSYSDGTTNYISKSYYESFYSLTGESVPAGLANLKAEYIAIDSGIDMNSMKELFTQPDSLIKLSKNVFGNSDIDLPYVQNAREYTLNLDANQTIDLVGKTVKAAVNNIDSINSTFKLGLPAEAIQQIKTGANNQTIDTGLSKAKTVLAGSTVSEKESFTDDSYKQDMNVNLQIKDCGKISIQLASTSNKGGEKAIDMPTSTVKLTKEEFNKLMMPEAKNATANQNVQLDISSAIMSAAK